MIERTLTGPKPKHPLPAGTIDTQMHAYMPGFPAVEGGPAVPSGAPGPAEYRQVMEWLGIDRLVVTQGNAHQLDNSNLLASLEAFGPIARGIAAIDGNTTREALQALHDAGVRGTRIMDLPGGAIGMTGLETVDALAAEMGWCVAVQMDGGKLLSHLPRMLTMHSRYIFDHHGKFLQGATPDSPKIDAVKRMLDRGNCWFKFAGCYESSQAGAPDYEDIAAVAREIAAYAPERIVWGTNWPHNMTQTTADYPNDVALLDLVMEWVPDEATRQKLFVDNPADLFDF